MPTILEIAQTVKDVDPKTGKRLKRSLADRAPEPASLPTEGVFHELTPSQILSVYVPTMTVNGKVEGYQRPPSPKQVVDMASSIRAGKKFPVAELVRLPDGRVDGTDCQHRALAHVMADRPMDSVIRPMTEDEARQMFHDQDKGKKIPKDVTVLTADNPFGLYCKDALENTSNPWHELVARNSSSNRVGVGTLYTMLGIYVGNRPIIDNTHESNEHMRTVAFDRGAAADLYVWVSTFGPKRIYPEPFIDGRLRAISTAALLIMRRRQIDQEDRKRWTNHMSLFPFEDYKKVRVSGEIARALVEWWNRKLPKNGPRYVELPTRK